MNLYLVIILIILAGHYLLSLVVERKNIKHLNPQLPDEFKDFYDPDKYAKSQQYTRENSTFGLIQSTITLAIIIPFILLGGFNTIDKAARSASFGPIITGIFFIGILALLSGLIALPFAVYDNFVIEEKYGFNKSTVKTFILDIIKNLVLLIIIGTPLFALVVWFFQETGTLAPLYIWVIVSLFQLFMMLIVPTVIMPLFNKYTPLEEGTLKDTLEQYAREYDFHLKGIYKMDESKRTTKPNAFFTGFGKFRRIVLFDTLIEKYTDDELLTTLAHEMGHYKLKHIPKMFIAAILETGLILFALSLFINNKELFAAFKMENLSVYASLVFFGFLYSPISTIISIVMNIFSRKREYEADRFAIETTGKGEEMITALKKLSLDTLSNLTPHPLKVFFYYSHPPVLARIQAIKALNASGGQKGSFCQRWQVQVTGAPHPRPVKHLGSVKHPQELLIDYSQIAHLYDVYVNTDFDFPFFLKEAEGCSKVLELTSGTGRLSIPLIEAGIPLTCLDRSPEMLALLRKKLIEKKLKAQVYQMDICHLDLKDTYDLVIIPFHAFAEILDPRDQLNALTGIYNLVSPKGRFICTLHNPFIRLKTINGQLKQIGKFPLPNAEGTLSLSAIEQYNAANCRVKGKQFYEVYDTNGVRLSKSTVDIQFCLHKKESFQELVRSAGFKVKEIYGDYSHSPFEADKSPFMIWILNKDEYQW